MADPTKTTSTPGVLDDMLLDYSANFVGGQVLTVGVGKAYGTIAAAVAAAHDGDVIKVQAGVYYDDFATITHSITIEGVGGTAHLVAGSEPEKGILNIGDSSSRPTVTLKGLEFSGARNGDGNGAGVRYQGGNLTLVNTYFHDNQDGFLGNPDLAGTITIKDSEFFRNGDGDGQSHNIYVGDVAQLVVDGVYSHDANLGHELKSRAEVNLITNSRFYDNGSTSSLSIDLPQGGNSVVRGNVIEQGPRSDNGHIIGYGEEGWIRGFNASSQLVLEGNTIINDRTDWSMGLLNATGTAAQVRGNTIYGLDQYHLASGPASVSGNTFVQARPALDLSRPQGLAAPVQAVEFDPEYYLAHNPDVAAAGMSPRQHYDNYGWKDGRDPSALFDTRAYLAHNPDVAAAKVNPLEHWLHNGRAEGRAAYAVGSGTPSTAPSASQGTPAPASPATPSDTASSSGSSSDAVAPPASLSLVTTTGTAIQAGMSSGTTSGKPSLRQDIMGDGFDAKYYLAQNADVAAAGVDAHWHFDHYGWREGRNADALFDVKYYLSQNPDVRAAGVNPLEHYASFGWHEGRNPSAAFDTNAYLAAYKDVAAAGANPLTHYLQYGAAEGRSAFGA